MWAGERRCVWLSWLHRAEWSGGVAESMNEWEEEQKCRLWHGEKYSEGCFVEILKNPNNYNRGFTPFGSRAPIISTITIGSSHLMAPGTVKFTITNLTLLHPPPQNFIEFEHQLHSIHSQKQYKLTNCKGSSSRKPIPNVSHCGMRAVLISQSSIW